MAIIRVQATSVGYWRGKPHRWHNTFHYSVTAGSPNYMDFITKVATILYNLGSTQAPGGISSIAAYPTPKGVPLAEKVLFDWTAPGSWAGWNGSFWGTTGSVPPMSGEDSARFDTRAGFSKTGKPVNLRTYWHSFATAVEDTGAAQFSGTALSTAQTTFNGLKSVTDVNNNQFLMVTPAGNPVASTSTLNPYVVTHQRTKGRKRKVKVVVQQADGPSTTTG